MVTLGCAKNIFDSEVMMAQLKANDYQVEHESEEQDASIVIINTCGFIDNAKEESINTILAWAKEKEKGNVDKVLVTGCGSWSNAFCGSTAIRPISKTRQCRRYCNRPKRCRRGGRLEMHPEEIDSE